MGANSKTSAATTVDRGELASLLAGCPWAEEYLSNVQSTNDAHCAQAGRRRRAGARRRRSLEGDPGQAVRVGEIRARVPVEMISRFASAPKRGQLFFDVLTTTESSRRKRKALPTSWCAQCSTNKLAALV